MKGYPIIFLHKPIAVPVLAAGGGSFGLPLQFLSAFHTLLVSQLFITTSDFLIRKPKNFHL